MAKRGAPRPFRIARIRVLYRMGRSRKTAPPHGHRGNRNIRFRGKLAVVSALITHEVEKLVAFDGPTDSAAELVVPPFGIALSHRRQERRGVNLVLGAVCSSRPAWVIGSP